MGSHHSDPQRVISHVSFTAVADCNRKAKEDQQPYIFRFLWNGKNITILLLLSVDRALGNARHIPDMFTN